MVQGCNKTAFVTALTASQQFNGAADPAVLGWYLVSCSKHGAQCRLRCRKGFRIMGGLADGNITYDCQDGGKSWLPSGGAVRFDPFKGMVPCGEESKVEGCDVGLMDFGVGRLYSCMDVKLNPWLIFGTDTAEVRARAARAER